MAVLSNTGAVLLKNTWGDGGLPLNRAAIQSLALVGPNANNSRGQLCSYYNEFGPCGGWGAVTTPLDAFTEIVATVRFAPGCYDTFCANASLLPEAVQGQLPSGLFLWFCGCSLSCSLPQPPRAPTLLSS